MEHVIVVKNGPRIVGIASNLKKALSMIESRWLHGYSTIAMTLSVCKPYPIGSGTVNGIHYDDLKLEKYEVNTFPGSRGRGI